MSFERNSFLPLKQFLELYICIRMFVILGYFYMRESMNPMLNLNLLMILLDLIQFLYERRLLTKLVHEEIIRVGKYCAQVGGLNCLIAALFVLLSVQGMFEAAMAKLKLPQVQRRSLTLQTCSQVFLPCLLCIYQLPLGIYTQKL